MKILIDNYDTGEEIGRCDIGTDDGSLYAVVKCVTGRHSVFFVFEDGYSGWAKDSFKDRSICELEGFIFQK